MDPFEFSPWYPKGVSRYVGAGVNSYVAVFEDKFVLKYPHVPPGEKDVYPNGGLEFRLERREASLKGLEVEEQILRRLGEHNRIVCLIRKHDDGLVLEHMRNGSVESYLRDVAPDTSVRQRLQWAEQAAEGLAYVHEKNVLHCDFNISNLLLNSNLEIKLCDFQGTILKDDGSIHVDGGAEMINPLVPPSSRKELNRKSDIIAFGITVYNMMTCKRPFFGLHPIKDEGEIRSRFEKGEYPPLEPHLGGDVVRKCWMRSYESAMEAMFDLQKLTLSAETGPVVADENQPGDTMV